MRFLIVDNDEQTLKLLNDFLSQYGTCQNYIKRENLISYISAFDIESVPNVFFISEIWGDETAFEILDKFRCKNRNIYDKINVVIMSESEIFSSIMSLYARKKTQFIKKPIAISELISILKIMDVIDMK